MVDLKHGCKSGKNQKRAFYWDWRDRDFSSGADDAA